MSRRQNVQQPEQEKTYWNTNALEKAKKKRKKKNICDTKLNGFISCSVYSLIGFGVFMLCRAHFRDYINFQPTTKWGILRHAWEFCRFSICEMQCAVVYRAHALLLMCGKRVNEKEKCNEKEQMNWNKFFWYFGYAAFACYIRSLTFFGLDFQSDDWRKLHMQCKHTQMLT